MKVNGLTIVQWMNLTTVVWLCIDRASPPGKQMGKPYKMVLHLKIHVKLLDVRKFARSKILINGLI